LLIHDDSLAQYIFILFFFNVIVFLWFSFFVVCHPHVLYVCVCRLVVADHVTLADFRGPCTSQYYRPGPVDKFEQMVLGEWMPEWESALSKRAWVAGDALTLADFALAETLEGLSLYLTENGTAKENSLAPFPAVRAYLAKFKALPKVAAYQASAGYMARPFNNKSAAWK
jgi:hypothetical protein